MLFQFDPDSPEATKTQRDKFKVDNFPTIIITRGDVPVATVRGLLKIIKTKENFQLWLESQLKVE